jgi:hypothetical protein
MADLKFYRGDTRTLSIAVKRQSQAVNLAGASLTFTAKRSVADADDAAIIQKSVGLGITVDDEPGGLATLTILPEDTSGITTVPLTLQYDLQLTEADETVTTVARGQLTILDDVTRST